MSELNSQFQDYLSERSDDLTAQQWDEFSARFRDLMQEVDDVAECDHDDVVAEIPPEYLDRKGSTLLTHEMETGVVTVLRGKCKDCGASVDTALEITTHEEGDDD